MSDDEQQTPSSIFRAGPFHEPNAYVGINRGEGSFGLYAAGFFDAGEQLARVMLQNRGKVDLSIYALVYMYRHGTELAPPGEGRTRFPSPRIQQYKAVSMPGQRLTTKCFCTRGCEPSHSRVRPCVSARHSDLKIGVTPHPGNVFKTNRPAVRPADRSPTDDELIGSNSGELSHPTSGRWPHTRWSAFASNLVGRADHLPTSLLETMGFGGRELVCEPSWLGVGNSCANLPGWGGSRGASGSVFMYTQLDCVL